MSTFSASQIPASIARANGELVTTRCTMGGIGEGLLIQGFVFKSGGNGFFYPQCDLDAYLRDGGNGYRDAIRHGVKSLEGRSWERCEALDKIRAEVEAEKAAR